MMHIMVDSWQLFISVGDRSVRGADSNSDVGFLMILDSKMQALFLLLEGEKSKQKEYEKHLGDSKL